MDRRTHIHAHICIHIYIYIYTHTYAESDELEGSFTVKLHATRLQLSHVGAAVAWHPG